VYQYSIFFLKTHYKNSLPRQKYSLAPTARGWRPGTYCALPEHTVGSNEIDRFLWIVRHDKGFGKSAVPNSPLLRL
jgi:hypothetical protein